jgi:psp operon transcriptional activator
MHALITHGWPGNVRELKNASERSLYRWIAKAETGPVGTIVLDPFAGPHRAPSTVSETLEAVPQSEAPPVSRYDFRRELDLVEKRWSEQALLANAWNQRAAADALGLSYDQMRGLIRKHGLKARPST